MQNLVPSSSAQLIPQLPNDVAISACEYLDSKTIILTIQVCKSWKDNQKLNRRIRRDAFERLRQGYPLEMIRLFQSRNIPLLKLPVLDLGDRMGNNDCIDMLNPSEMPDPIMRFRDRLDRPGIALHLQGHADGHLRAPGEDGDDRPRQTPIRDISGVFAVFKRYANQDSWKIGTSGVLNFSMAKLHEARHRQNDHVGDLLTECPSCPKGMRNRDDVSYTTLANLLDSQDPLFKIARGYTASRSLQAPAQEEEKKMPPQKK